MCQRGGGDVPELASTFCLLVIRHLDYNFNVDFDQSISGIFWAVKKIYK
jgi:hypothetical protein